MKTIAWSMKLLRHTIDRVQDDILERHDPVMALIDRAFGRLDEYLLSRLISSWRQDVWEKAQEMLAAENDQEREILRQSLENRVMRRTRMLSFNKEIE